MIKEKTLFILGAGASYPYDFPTADTLKQKICTEFEGSYIGLLKKRRGFKTNDLRFMNPKIREFIDPFAKSSVSSIDLYLKRKPQFSEFGKHAIILSILRAEQKSKFWYDVSKENRTEDWYSFLARALTEDIIPSEDVGLVSANEVKFLTFNYDRSLEYFLVNDFKNSFNDLSYQKAVDIVSSLHIEHVFGNLELFGEGKVDYGDMNHTFEDYEKLLNKIQTIYEVENNNKYKDLIEWADRIFILGFGFAKENLKVLGLPQFLSKDQMIYATALGLGERVKRITEDSFFNDWHGKIDKSKTSPQKDNYLDSIFRIEPKMDSVKLLDKYL